MGGDKKFRKSKIVASSPIEPADEDASAKSWVENKSCNSDAEEVFYFSPGGTDKSGHEHDSSSGIYSLSSPSDSSLNNSLVKTVSQKDEAIKTLEHKLHNLESFKEYLESEVQQLLDENEQLNSKLKKAQQDLDAKEVGRKDVGDFQDSENPSSADLQSLCNDLSTELAAAKSVIQELRADKEKLLADLSKLRDENYQVIRENLKVSSEKLDYERNVKELGIAVKELNDKLETRLDEIQRLQHSLGEKSKLVRTLENQIGEANQENEYLKQRIQELGRKDSNAGECADESLQEIETERTIQSNLQAVVDQDQLQETRNQIEQLKKDLAKCQNSLIAEKEIHQGLKEKIMHISHPDYETPRRPNAEGKCSRIPKEGVESTPRIFQARDLDYSQDLQFLHEDYISAEEDRTGPKVVKTPYNRGRSRWRETFKLQKLQETLRNRENGGFKHPQDFNIRARVSQPMNKHRYEELQRRNAMLPPHMKSSYPSENVLPLEINSEDLNGIFRSSSADAYLNSRSGSSTRLPWETRIREASSWTQISPTSMHKVAEKMHLLKYKYSI